jgi:hypothetical protein
MLSQAMAGQGYNFGKGEKARMMQAKLDAVARRNQLREYAGHLADQETTDDDAAVAGAAQAMGISLAKAKQLQQQLERLHGAQAA